LCFSPRGKGKGGSSSRQQHGGGRGRHFVDVVWPCLALCVTPEKRTGQFDFFFFFLHTQLFLTILFATAQKNDYCLLSLDFGCPVLFFYFYFLGTEFVFGGLLFQTVCPAPILFYGPTNAHRLCIVATNAAIGSYNFKERKK
jgi:hypothetical protein